MNKIRSIFFHGILIGLLTISLSSCVTNYYLVRHAEKVTGERAGPNPSLTEAGEMRAKILCDTLKKNPPQFIFSTNTVRTMTTANPISDFTGIGVHAYSIDTIPGFVERLKKIHSKSILIVGHTESVCLVVNGLMDKKVMGFIPENNYDTLVIVKYFRGLSLRKKVYFNNYGPPSP